MSEQAKETTGRELVGRTIAVGVDGGPGSYVAADVIRRLVRWRATVKVVVTESTERWLPALTLATLSGHPVATTAESGREIAGECEAALFIISSTDILASEVAVNAAGALFLDASLPRVVAPTPSLHGSRFGRVLLQDLEKEVTVLPSGESPEDVASALVRELEAPDLVGKRLMVTAGPTREKIDPVRFISNPSSGRMGEALAIAALKRGAEVTLLHGPWHLRPPPSIRAIPFQTAEDLRELASSLAGDMDAIIASAAVGDYAPVSPAENKIKKGEGDLVLRLRRTPDVLATLGRRFVGKKNRPVLVGFAAETEEMVENARKKLKSKHLDLVVANDVGKESTGFASRDIEVVLVSPTGAEEVPRSSKKSVAHAILDRVSALIKDRRPS